MSKIWIFGDSFSCPWNDVEWGTHKEYVDKYQPEIHYSDLLSEKLNLDGVRNYARAGFCNYSILESVGKVIHKIGSEDYVVIGWSEITRWRCTSLLKDEWTVLSTNFSRPFLNSIDKKYSHTLRYESVSRDTDLPVQEIKNWISILDKALPKVLHWTPFPIYIGKSNKIKKPKFKLKTIDLETDIKDKHITEEGHKDVANWLFDLFTTKVSKDII